MISKNDLYYLNLKEIKYIFNLIKKTKNINIPINIFYINNQNKIIKSNDFEAKRYLINKLDNFFNNNIRNFEKTIYNNNIVKIKDFKNNYTKNDKLLYGDFKSTNKNLLKFLKSITNNEFKFGAIAFLEAHKIWRKNKVVSLNSFSKIWLKAMKKYDGKFPEWAYISDLKKGFDKSKWKKYRQNKADKIINKINIYLS